MFEMEYRDLTTVNRWSVLRRLREQNLAEHSYFVTLYADQIATMLQWRSPLRVELMRTAMLHDLGEIWFGDHPGPSKAQVVDKDKLDNLESKRMSVIFGPYANMSALVVEEYERAHSMELGSVAAEMKLIVKAADHLDAMIYLINEMRMGNSYAEPESTSMAAQCRKSWKALSTLGDVRATDLERRVSFIYQKHLKGNVRTVKWGEVV